MLAAMPSGGSEATMAEAEASAGNALMVVPQNAGAETGPIAALYYQHGEPPEASDECKMPEVARLLAAGEIRSETMVRRRALAGLCAPGSHRPCGA